MISRVHEPIGSLSYDPRATAWLKTTGQHYTECNRCEQCDILGGPKRRLLVLLYKTGLRVDELVQLDVEMLDFENGVLMLPAAVQKDYLNDNSPVYAEIALADETVRVLQTYLAGCWKDVETLFPSRSADRVRLRASGTS